MWSSDALFESQGLASIGTACGPRGPQVGLYRRGIANEFELLADERFEIGLECGEIEVLGRRLLRAHPIG
jgi:hypothetical protein